MRIYGILASTVIFALLSASGCAERNGAITKLKIDPNKTIEIGVEPEGQKPTIKLALKFSPGDSATFKVTTETRRQATWEGLPSKRPAEFKGGQSGNKIEMTFNQHIQSIDDKGNAVVKITIEGLKYQTKVTDNIVTDFDSSREDSKNNPLSKLIGQSYTIEITTSGQVSRIIDVNDILSVVSDGSSAGQMALNLLSINAIKARHNIPGLPAEKNELSVGESWDSIKSFSFDQMGSKSYGKTYTLEEIQDADNRPIAIIRMNAIPSVEQAKELYKEQTTLPFLFDSTETYTGQMKLNLAEGKMEECREQLLTEWIAIDPDSKTDERPDSIKMSATQLYSLERVD